MVAIVIEEYAVHNGGSLTRLRQEDFQRLKFDGYKQCKRGFYLMREDREVALLSCNEDMRKRTEREIRQFLCLPDQPNYVKDEKKPFNGLNLSALKIRPEEKKELQTATKPHPASPKPTKFFVALSSYDSSIGIFMPAAFIGQKFSCIYADGKFLVSPDSSGVEAKKNTIERCVCNFSLRDWFSGITFPTFHQFKIEVTMDIDGFEIPMPLSHQPKQSITIPNKEARTVEIVQYQSAKETRRDRAKRYVSWLNDFCAEDGYTIKSENNRLVLERSDRID